VTARPHVPRPPGVVRTATLVLFALVVALLPGGAAGAAASAPRTATVSAGTTSGASLPDGPRRYGTLQTDPDRLPSTTGAGVDLVTMGVSWKRFEPVESRVDATYLAELTTTLQRYRAARVDVVLSPGVQYAPTWLLAHPDSRFVNQYGDAYAPTESGKTIANMVFVQRMRDKQEAYLQRLFSSLGTDFYGVRLGGGWYGELNYPEASYAGRTNAYWGFDPVATGARPGLATGVTTNPVPTWKPGTASPDHAAARSFAEWYLESQRNYHDWQISTVRGMYPGRLLMMYPSWGVRPGQLDAAVAGDLSGQTSAERNGEVQRGFDFARYVRGITDPGVVLYTTWLNADRSQDAGTDQRYWSPVKFLAHLSAQRSKPLALMGENTGRDTPTDMAVTFDQARAHRLIGVVWAFEPDLFTTGTGYASVSDLAAAITEDRRLGTPALGLTAPSLPPATVSQAYTAPVAATGGAAPYSWHARGLPVGLSLISDGGPTATVSGTTTAAGTHQVLLSVTDRWGTTREAGAPLSVTAPVWTPPVVLPVTAAPRELVAVPHTRLLDTRTGLGTSAGPLRAGGLVTVPVAGTAGVPADAEAVVLRISGDTTRALTRVTVLPAGDARHYPVTLPLSARGADGGLVVVAPGSQGRVAIRTDESAHVAVDLQGYVPAGSTFGSTVPARVLDTRVGTGTAGGLLPAETVRSFPVRGVGGVPEDATAVVLSMTVTGATGSGELAVAPSGTKPWRPALRFATGEDRAVLVLTRIGDDGRVSVRTSAPGVHVLADVQGWHGPGDLTTVAPVRILDTRNGNGAPKASVPPGGSVVLQVAGRGGVPTGARSAFLHTTVLSATKAGQVHLGATDERVPDSPVVTFGAGQVNAAPALVDLGADGRVRFTNRSAGTVHLTVELSGWTTR